MPWEQSPELRWTKEKINTHKSSSDLHLHCGTCVRTHSCTWTHTHAQKNNFWSEWYFQSWEWSSRVGRGIHLSMLVQEMQDSLLSELPLPWAFLKHSDWHSPGGEETPVSANCCFFSGLILKLYYILFTLHVCTNPSVCGGQWTTCGVNFLPPPVSRREWNSCMQMPSATTEPSSRSFIC